MQVHVRIPIIKFQTSQDLSTAILNATTSFAVDIKIVEVRIHFSGAVTETVTIKTDDAGGANFDTVLKVENLNAATDFVFRPDGHLILKKGDELNVQVSKATATQTAYLTVIGEEI